MVAADNFMDSIAGIEQKLESVKETLSELADGVSDEIIRNIIKKIIDKVDIIERYIIVTEDYIVEANKLKSISKNRLIEEDEKEIEKMEERED